ncbi:hypothetical protein VNI00_001966 [Paramarasmius palmivorus]|uniref:FAD/NAD(P)-binding domain-containing protein n=1 Tax=Paramarasmius palmivorus TaxID=297713 RepID=A0AAW0E1Z5_9AGAR
MSSRTIKVAVIGSGLAGLTAAHLLTEGRSSDEDVVYEVHLFEKTSALGMDSSSISLPIPGEERDWRIDVPMRSLQGGYYTRLIAFYKHLGVSFRTRNYSYSFASLSPRARVGGQDITTSMIYNGRSGLAGVSIPSKVHLVPDIAGKARALFTFAIMTMQLLLCYLRLLILSVPIQRSPDVSTTSFGSWVERTTPRGRIMDLLGLDTVWTDFAMNILMPWFSGVCSCSMEDVKQYPVEEFLDFVWTTLGTHHYVAKDGVRDVVSRLSSRISHIHLSSPISGMESDPKDPRLVSIRCSTASGDKVHSGFGHVIFATQAPRAIPILKSYALSLTPSTNTYHAQLVNDQIACLQHFLYRTSIVINHTDESLVPNNAADRRELNLIVAHPSLTATTKTEKKGQEEWVNYLPPTYTMATQILRRPEGYPDHLPAVFQTTNPVVEPRAERILSVAKLERAVPTLASKEALKSLHVEAERRWWGLSGPGEGRLGSLQGAGKSKDLNCGPGIWLCGSYAYSGIPLLEGCVVSARHVVEQGIWVCEGTRREIPW